MKKNIYIYDNNRQSTGIYVSEHLTPSYNGGDCEEITVEIPESMEPYETVMEETAVKIGEGVYRLDDVLRLDKNEQPYIMGVEPGTKSRKLKIISRNGRRSLAMTL